MACIRSLLMLVSMTLTLTLNLTFERLALLVFIYFALVLFFSEHCESRVFRLQKEVDHTDIVRKLLHTWTLVTELKNNVTFDPRCLFLKTTQLY